MAERERLCMNCMEETPEEGACPHCGFHPSEPQMRQALPYRTVLQGRYLVGRARSCNGEGIAYVGYDTVQREKISLREFFPQTLCGRAEQDGKSVQVIGGSETVFDEYLTSFLSNARAVAHLRDLSAIEQIYDIFEENGTAYAVAEKDESITLRYFVERSGGSLDWNLARQLFMPELNALSQMSANGVRHFGISPDTLVIRKDGKMKLEGFGISAVRRMDTDLQPDLVAGCAALEQYTMDAPVGEPTDVYGFAATLFFALTGSLPQSALKRRSDSRLMIPTSILRTLPPHVATALANALQVQPERRTQTFEQLRDELSAAPTVTAKIEASQPIREIPAPPPRKERQRRGVPGVVWLLGSCVIALAVFSFIGFTWMSSGVQTQDPASSTVQAIVPEGAPLPESSAPSESAAGVAMIDVPNLVGSEYESLLESASSANLAYEILLSEKQFDDTVPEGQIISQSPQAGSKIAPGGTITIVVSLGASSRELPDITNLTLAQASERVTAEGFLPVKEDVYDPLIESGRMVGYRNAESGDTLPYGSQIVILMSIGPDPHAGQ